MARMARPRIALPTDLRQRLTWDTLTRAVRLREGWGTVFLAACLTLLVQQAILRAEWAGELRILPSVTLAGLLVGFVLAKIGRLPNYLAHLIGLCCGLAVVWLRTLSVLDDKFGGTRGKSIELAHRIGHYVRAAWNGGAEDDLFLFVLFMGLMMFFVGYFTMWWLFRSHWLSPALGVSGLILLVNLGYDREDSKIFLALFLLVAIPLVVRYHAYRQEAGWDTAHIKYPSSLGWRFTSVATGLSIALLFAANLVPFSLHSGPVNVAFGRATAPWQNFEGRFEQYFPSIEGRGRTRNTFPGFAAFGESFQFGGGLNLPEDPAVSLKCDGTPAQYVKMNTYDFYTGHGFKKKLPDGFTAQQPDGSTYDPRVQLDANKPVPQAPAADQTAKSAACTAQLYRPRGNLLPVLGEQLEQVNAQALLSVGWQNFGQTGVHVPPQPGEQLPVQLTDLVRKVTSLQGLTVPVDPPPVLRPGAPPQASLQRDGTLVIYVPQGSTFTFPPDFLAQLITGAQQGQPGQPPPPKIMRVVVAEAPVISPTATPSVASVSGGSISAMNTIAPPTATPQPPSALVSLDRRFDTIIDEQNRLATNLIQTQVVIQNGKVTQILYRGQAPNYGDIEQVLSVQPVPVGKEVTENTRISEATEDDLRGAPTALPKWTSRYTQLPDGITQRTADLADSITKGTTNEYDMAASIEQYLRANYLYLDRVNLPPYDRDAVDYFLFQSKQGYCEYFSSAMLVLARLNGLPAREVVGYLPGGKSEDGRYVSRENQAHAWVEIYFPQYGWLTFDPTPRPGVVPIPRGPLAAELPPPDPANPDQTTGDLSGGQDRLDQRAEDRLRELDDQLNGGSYSGGFYIPAKHNRAINPLFLSIPALFALFALVLCALWLRTFRGVSGSGQWYARMTRSAALVGLTRPTRATTPLEVAAAVGQRLPGSKDAAQLIARQYMEERYAGVAPDAKAMKEGQSSWLRLRRLIVQSVLPKRRRTAARPIVAAPDDAPAINPRGRRQK